MEEWENEPNWLEFEHAGFKCLIARGSDLNLTGYVGVPEGHLYYGKSYKKVNVNAHRGLSSGAKLWDAVEERWMEGWWFGFDCACPGDLVPAKGKQTENEVYRNMDYVTNEVKKLAEQLAAFGTPDRKETATLGKKISGLFRKFKG